ncbi:putative adenylate kinase 1, chloroplastic [Cinnamomum micranthum f. kanehirae]|uniref:adenylate kinase n=1 Tax=Cinnamomum micranthum f. kanehirae TaxID=337451 RepID=A0A443PQ58_9MAGN|nr:putative adenylate kinase 1, chloroplastic [Cinnamomum micranthum f. kanehirae]
MNSSTSPIIFAVQLQLQLQQLLKTSIAFFFFFYFYLIFLYPSIHPSMAVLNRLFNLRSLSSPSSSSFLRGFSALTSETDLRPPPSLSNAGLLLPRDPKDRNVQWVFLGCPGVGKGTYASRLSHLLGVPHIATGDLVREELSTSGPLSLQLAEIVNQGKLVSDEIIISILSKRLESGGAKGESGFILDGFPRTIRQAEILEGVTEIDLVINLKLREDVLVEKCLGRRICSQCGGNFNVANISIKGVNGRPGIYMAPLLPPAHCASKLITRSDDTEAVVKERLRVYNDMCQSVEEFYRSRGKLLEFDLPGGIPESWPKLLHALNLEDHDDKQSAAA